MTGEVQGWLRSQGALRIGSGTALFPMLFLFSRILLREMHSIEKYFQFDTGYSMILHSKGFGDIL